MAAVSEILDQVWQQQSLWSQAANTAKSSILRSRIVTLVGTVTAAGAGALAAQLTDRYPVGGQVAAILAAAALAVVPFAARGAGLRPVQDWTRLRSVSEALKAEVYQYLAGVGPYRGADRDRVLAERTARSEADADDLAGQKALFTPVTRAVPAVSDVESYTSVRVLGQIRGYYRPAARSMGRRAAWFLRTATAASVVAAVASAVAGVVGSNLTAWVGVVTTLAAALVAFSTAQQYGYQQLEFTRTADQLERLRAGRPRDGSAGDPAREDLYVAECERVISVSNEGWMAKATESDTL